MASHSGRMPARVLLHVLVLLPIVLLPMFGELLRPVAAQAATTATEQMLSGVQVEIAKLNTRGCYVDDTVPTKDIEWGIIGRQGVFVPQQKMVRQYKDEQTSGEIKMRRLAEALQRSIANSNCYCDTRHPCKHNASCTNREPPNVHHTWSGGAWTKVAVASSSTTGMRLYECACPSGTVAPNCESILPCCSTLESVRNENSGYKCVTPSGFEGGDASSRDACELTGNRFSTYRQANQAESNSVHTCTNGGLTRSKDACERTGNTYTPYGEWAQCNAVC
jgi:hypothetical protein